MKFVETARDAVHVDPVGCRVTWQWEETGEDVVEILVVDKADVRVLMLGTTRRMCELDFVPNLNPEELHRLAAYMIQARLSARLADDRISYIPYDYVEFMHSFFEEHREFLQAAEKVSEKVRINWIATAARRATGGLILISDAYGMQRRPDGRFRVNELLNGAELVYVAGESVHHLSNARMVYHGSLEECRRLREWLTELPWYETVTRTQMLRWLRHSEIATQPNTTIPTRSINLPQDHT